MNSHHLNLAQYIFRYIIQPTYSDLSFSDKRASCQTLVLDWHTVCMPTVSIHLECCSDQIDHDNMHHLMCPKCMSNNAGPMLLKTKTYMYPTILDQFSYETCRVLKFYSHILFHPHKNLHSWNEVVKTMATMKTAKNPHCAIFSIR